MSDRWLAWISVTGAFFGLSVMLFFAFAWSFSMREEVSNEKPVAGLGASHSEHTRTQDGQPVSGFSSGPGFQIVWQSQQAPTGATPLDVLESVQSRLQHMQKTKLGGDEIARALWEVNKAVEALSPTMRREGGSSGAGFVLPEGK